jgi:hypothetical protein
MGHKGMRNFSPGREIVSSARLAGLREVGMFYNAT